MKKFINFSTSLKFSAALMLVLGLLVSTVSAKKMRSSKPESKVKEYVVVSGDASSIASKLGELFDRLKTFANNPKNLKELQTKIDGLEDSLRKNVAQIKDCHYVINRTKTETAKLKNEIPTQKNNQKAKEVFDKIVDFWNNAEGEMEKITKYSEEFDKIAGDINSATQEIVKALETGNQEIDAIKEELARIAAIEEQIAGKDERELEARIDKNFGKKTAETPAVEESTENPVAQTPAPATSAADEQLTLAGSLSVLATVLAKFASVAFVGAKDIFTRLFLAPSSTPVDAPSAEKPASGNAPTEAPTAAISSQTKTETPSAAASDAAAPQQASEAIWQALTTLKDSFVTLATESWVYLQAKYAQMRETSAPEATPVTTPATEPKEAESMASEPSKTTKKKTSAKKEESSAKNSAPENMSKPAETKATASEKDTQASKSDAPAAEAAKQDTPAEAQKDAPAQAEAKSDVAATQTAAPAVRSSRRSRLKK